MKVDDLILQLQDLIGEAKSMPFSGGKVMVNSDDVYDIIEYLEEDDKNAENVERIKNYLKINGAKE